MHEALGLNIGSRQSGWLCRGGGLRATLASLDGKSQSFRGKRLGETGLRSKGMRAAALAAAAATVGVMMRGDRSGVDACETILPKRRGDWNMPISSSSAVAPCYGCKPVWQMDQYSQYTDYLSEDRAMSKSLCVITAGTIPRPAPATSILHRFHPRGALFNTCACDVSNKTQSNPSTPCVQAK